MFRQHSYRARVWNGLLVAVAATLVISAPSFAAGLRRGDRTAETQQPPGPEAPASAGAPAGRTMITGPAKPAPVADGQARAVPGGVVITTTATPERPAAESPAPGALASRPRTLTVHGPVMIAPSGPAQPTTGPRTAVSASITGVAPVGSLGAGGVRASAYSPLVPAETTPVIRSLQVAQAEPTATTPTTGTTAPARPAGASRTMILPGPTASDVPAPTAAPVPPAPSTQPLQPVVVQPTATIPPLSTATVPMATGTTTLTAGPATRLYGPGAVPTAAMPTVSGGSYSLTPESAARLAVQNSIDLKITAANVREAEAGLRQAFGLDDFRVDISATYGRRGPIATASFGEGDQATTIELGDPEINTQQLEMVKPLYTSRKIERAQDVAARALETQKLSKAVVARALDLAARSAVYGVLRAEQLTEVAQQRANSVAAHVDLTKKLNTAGVVPKFEVVQAETELSQAQGDVIAARTAVEQSKAGLRRLLTLSQDSGTEVKPGELLTIPEGSRSALVEQAWQRRPEIHTANSSVALAQAALRLAAVSSGLSVNLVGGLTRANASFGAEAWGWQVAVAASKPILDGKIEETEVQKSKAQLDAAVLRMENVRQEIALEVTQAYVALDESRQTLEVARQGLIEADERLRIAKVRYENGIALGVEVLDAQTALAAAQADVINSHYSLQSSIADLRSAVGLWSGNE